MFLNIGKIIWVWKQGRQMLLQCRKFSRWVLGRLFEVAFLLDFLVGFWPVRGRLDGVVSSFEWDNYLGVV